MPKQPNDRYQQDSERAWRPAEAAGRFPGQPPYQEARTGHGAQATLSWSDLNSLPAGTSSRRGLSTH
ncbi:MULTISPECIES: DNA repair protein [unclassified Micromonospora]|uniref:DNA repair protein n=1 Tax=unclassified Micromonospora TaxID=2617518 RepID=UPI001043A9FD|nr:MULTISPECIES: DNA repair protein [unclassified Micromonospora]TDB79405.1 DNA repair protein [Micromonospora sp. KC721]TDC42153.1 DNA repair protein [Micromonospora sp. KC213]